MGCILGTAVETRSECDMSPVKHAPVLFVSGVPGAGSRTVSDLLASLTDYHVVVPGQLVRAEAARTDSLRGRSLAKMIRENTTIPEEIIVDLVKEDMLEHSTSKGFILCGFPRNRRMAHLYKREVKAPEKVISLQVADEIAVHRLRNVLNDLGCPQRNIQDACQKVRQAAPGIKRVQRKFKGQSVTVNSSDGNLQTLQKSIHEASDSFKNLLKNPEHIYLLDPPQTYQTRAEVESADESNDGGARPSSVTAF